MARYRVLVFLLVVAALVTGRQTGPDPSFNAILPMMAMLALGYFVARPEIYNPDVPFYQPGGMEQTRKWARWITFLGLAAFALFWFLPLSAFSPGPLNRSAPSTFHIAISLGSSLSLMLVFVGFFAWCLAVFFRKK